MFFEEESLLWTTSTNVIVLTFDKLESPPHLYVDTSFFILMRIIYMSLPRTKTSLITLEIALNIFSIIDKEGSSHEKLP